MTSVFYGLCRSLTASIAISMTINGQQLWQAFIHFAYSRVLQVGEDHHRKLSSYTTKVERTAMAICWQQCACAFIFGEFELPSICSTSLQWENPFKSLFQRCNRTWRLALHTVSQMLIEYRSIRLLISHSPGSKSNSSQRF